MDQEEDYFAPLGMSQLDFNSMLRRRNLANLTQHLIEQGRVTLPGTGTSTVPSNAAQLVKVEDGVTNFAEPQVADFVDEDVTRKSSSLSVVGLMRIHRGLRCSLISLAVGLRFRLRGSH
jgi:hypothetical protein